MSYGCYNVINFWHVDGRHKKVKKIKINVMFFQVVKRR